jgi:type IV secretion system protein VirB5
LITTLETGGLIALSMKAKTVPYVVAVDSLGRLLAAGPAERASQADDRLKRAALFQWVSDLRSVTTDGVAQRKAIDRVYAMIANGSPAQVEIGEFFRNDPPYQRAQTKTVDVDVKAVFAASDRDLSSRMDGDQQRSRRSSGIGGTVERVFHHCGKPTQR